MPFSVHRRVHTYSIVAYDPEAKEWGVASESKFLAVGAVVPWARANAGAVATQSYANTSYGPRALDMFEQGLSAQEALERLIADDPDKSLRQMGLVDARGGSATFTGDGCYPWSGGVAGEGFAAQGNILASEAVVHAMADTFQTAKGSLADRLVAALAAGQEAGGDRRGQQSACLLVVKEAGGYGGMNDRYVDLRTDDHPEPVKELARLLDLYKLYFFETRPEDLLPMREDLTREIQEILQHFGYYRADVTGQMDETTLTAFRAYAGTENLEERFRDDGQIDRVVLEYMREHRRRSS